jgi:REP element-mobilizing transposase RayT
MEKIRHFIFIKIIITQVFVFCNILGAKFIYILENLPCRLRKTEKIRYTPFEIYRILLTKCGQIADKYIRQLNDFYDDLSVESYVIMPNHIHIMLWVKGAGNGPSRTPVPTVQNSVPSRFVSTFKRFCNKEYGINIWQYRSNDHIIRDRQDYEEHLRYIYENPIRWCYDELYAEE